MQACNGIVSERRPVFTSALGRLVNGTLVKFVQTFREHLEFLLKLP